MARDELDCFLEELEELLNKYNMKLEASYLDRIYYEDGGTIEKIGVDPYILILDKDGKGMYLSTSELP